MWYDINLKGKYFFQDKDYQDFVFFNILDIQVK